jgi:hypothetical protein
MSFFKKIGSEFGDKDKAGQRSAPDGYNGQSHGYYQRPPYQQQPYPHQPGYGPPQQPGYGPPQQSSYGSPQPQYAAYGAPPPVPHRPSYEGQAYYPPPPVPPPAPGNAELPPGWAARFDENFKSWYYVNEATRVRLLADPR